MMRLALPLILISLSAFGCSQPNAVNIALRKQVQDQAEEIERLKRQRAADLADNAAATQPATKPALAAGTADSLFTTHGIRLGRLSRATKGGLTLHVIPTDDGGDDFKAAGSIAVDAFDLSADGKRVGRWEFDLGATRPLWNGSSLRYEYVVPCPWQQAPSAEKVTVKVTFVDALTGRSFAVQQEMATQPE